MDGIALIKIVSALVYPLGLTFALLLCALLAQLVSRRHAARGLVIAALVLVLAASNPILSSKLLRSLEQQYPQQALAEIPRADLIVVLGGGLRLPQTPARYVQFTGGTDRYWHAARLYQAGKAKQVLVSGGNVFAQPDVRSEAAYAAELLNQWGVPADAILLEAQSRTTAANFDNARSIIENSGAQRIILVTSAFHMPRAIGYFASLPVAVIPASADIIVRDSKRPKMLDWLPSAQALSITTLALHEYYGMAFGKLKALIGND